MNHPKTYYEEERGKEEKRNTCQGPIIDLKGVKGTLSTENNREGMPKCSALRWDLHGIRGG